MRFRLIPFILVTCFTQYSVSQTLSSFIQSNITQTLPNTMVGVMVENAQSGRLLYGYHDHDYFPPASNTKLFTAAAALKQLGPNYTFETTFVRSPTTSLKQGKLAGNLYLHFGGDPSLTRHDVSDMVKELKQKGINTIAGNLVIDPTYFSGSPYALGVSRDDVNYCYGAPISSIIIDQNCLSIKIKLKQGQRHIIKNQTSELFTFTNQVHFTNVRDPKTCTFRPLYGPGNHITLTGCLPNNKSWPFRFAIQEPKAYAIALLSKLFHDHHIHIQGQVLIGVQPDKPSVLVSHSSQHLKTLLQTMLADSNNVYAGAITKAIGKAFYQKGTHKAGVSAIKAICAKMMGWKLKSMNLEDGAGASRYNLVAPREIVRLLYKIRHSSLYNDFYPALAISGQTGTMRYRLGTKIGINKVHAKTGTLTGVSNLSGYVETQRGHQLIFSIMMSGLTRPTATAHLVQNRIVQYLIEHE